MWLEGTSLCAFLSITKKTCALKNVPRQEFVNPTASAEVEVLLVNTSSPVLMNI